MDARPATRSTATAVSLPTEVSECTVTLVPTRGSFLSTAELRKPLVATSALQEFARGGLHGATIADVARAAKISPAYVLKLFPRKELLFVAALEECFAQVVAALQAGAEACQEEDAEAVLFAMGGAYADLVADRTLLMLQVHAQSVADIPEIGEALRDGLARVTDLAKTLSGATDDAVQHFMAYGQLCHLIVTARIDEIPEPWAMLLSRNIRHSS